MNTNHLLYKKGGITMTMKGKILSGVIIAGMIGICITGSIRLYNILFPEPWYVDIFNKIVGG